MSVFNDSENSEISGGSFSNIAGGFNQTDKDPKDSPTPERQTSVDQVNVELSIVAGDHIDKSKDAEGTDILTLTKPSSYLVNLDSQKRERQASIGDISPELTIDDHGSSKSMVLYSGGGKSFSNAIYGGSLSFAGDLHQTDKDPKDSPKRERQTSVDKVNVELSNVAGDHIDQSKDAEGTDILTLTKPSSYLVNLDSQKRERQASVGDINPELTIDAIQDHGSSKSMVLYSGGGKSFSNAIYGGSLSYIAGDSHQTDKVPKDSPKREHGTSVDKVNAELSNVAGDHIYRSKDLDPEDSRKQEHETELSFSDYGGSALDMFSPVYKIESLGSTVTKVEDKVKAGAINTEIYPSKQFQDSKKEEHQIFLDDNTSLSYNVDKPNNSVNQRFKNTYTLTKKIPMDLISKRDIDLLSKLQVAKNTGQTSSKACLEGTRVALLEQIYDWVEDPKGARVLLLSGAAGMGKSAVAHTVARDLENHGLAIAPFFAFDRSVQERSSSQLIPTWMRHLAEHNIEFFEYLHFLTDNELCSTDIANQYELLLNGLAHKIVDPI
ncbi:hypothetical protein H0H92_010432, partial [Tricholoma furcatifolium]